MALESAKGNPTLLVSLAYAYAARDNRERALELVDQYSVEQPTSLRSRTWEAAARLALGDEDSALTLLEESFEGGEGLYCRPIEAR